MRGWDVVQRNFARFRAGTGVLALARKFRVFKMLIGRWGREYNCSCSPDWEGADTAACQLVQLAQVLCSGEEG